MRIHAFFVYILLIPAGVSASPWQILNPGMELGTFPTGQPRKSDDSNIIVLRIDPNLWDMQFVGVSAGNSSDGQTAKQWSKSNQLSAVINAGMFEQDYSTHMGFLQFQGRLINSRINKYSSIAAFDPRHDGLPRFHIFDLDVPGVNTGNILKDYQSAVQNLRLIKRPGENRWKQQKKMWSEAALGEDKQGRILFIFCRPPFTMHDLNEELLGLPLELVSAQHLEGGPEAQLYIHVGEVELEFFGSFETSFSENDTNTEAWPVPNVLGIRPRKSTANKPWTP
jgi:hypothetical protein